MKLAYVVTEPGSLDPTTGASQHIAMGLRELGKHAEVVRFLPQVPESAPGGPRPAGKPGWWTRVQATGLWGAVRDIRDFARMVRLGWRLAKVIEKSGCTAAYVRVQALHPLPVFLRWRKIKVFLEANGLQFVSRKKRFRSWLFWLHRPFERYIYRTADHVFFVGSYGQVWQIAGGNWSEVENGIEPELVRRRGAPIAAGERLRIVFLARLMDHHKGHILPAAIARLAPSVRDRLEVHLVGTGFEQVVRELGPLCHVEDHGFVSREEIGGLLGRMDCGVIPDCPPYGSQMKLLDYAASGCLVMAPDVVHLKSFFDDKGVLFFKRNDPASLADRLEAVIARDLPSDDMARALQDHVREQYTWAAIFERKWERIIEDLRDDE